MVIINIKVGLSGNINNMVIILRLKKLKIQDYFCKMDHSNIINFKLLLDHMLMQYVDKVYFKTNSIIQINLIN